MTQWSDNLRLRVSLDFDDPFDAALLVVAIEERAAELSAQASVKDLHEYSRVAMADTVRVLEAISAQISSQLLNDPLYRARMERV